MNATAHTVHSYGIAIAMIALFAVHVAIAVFFAFKHPRRDDA